MLSLFRDVSGTWASLWWKDVCRQNPFQKCRANEWHVVFFLDTYGLSQMFLCSPSGWPLNFCASWFHQVSTGFRPVRFHVFLTNLGVRLFSRNLNLLHWSNCWHSLWVPVDASQMLWHGSPTQQVRGEEVTQVTKVESTRSIRCPDARKTAIHVENCGWIGHWNMLENACTKPIGIDWAETLRLPKLLPRWFDTNKICCEICSNELLTMLTQKYEIIHLVNLCCGRFFLWLWFYSWLWRNDLICKISKSNHDFRIVFVSTHGFHPAGKVFEIHQICKSKTRSESWATK